MNTAPMPNDESTMVEVKTKEDTCMGNTHELAVTIARDSNIKKEMYADCSSSSGDEDDGDIDDDEDEDESNDGKVAGEKNKNTPDGTSSVLQIPLQYTKSGRMRSVPFPVRVSV